MTGAKPFFEGGTSYMPSDLQRTRSGWRWVGPAAVAAALGTVTAYVASVNPNTSAAYPQCLSRVALGLDCPLCGGLRGVHALTHGDIPAALDHNAFAVLLLPLVVVLLAAWAAKAIGVGPERFRRLRAPNALVYGLLALGVVFTVVRNLPIPGLEALDSF